MTSRSETRWVALASLAFTYAFFFEYLPPFKVVHIPYDLSSYHYPLLDYAFRLLRQGEFPQWDPSIYCGISFVGNPQTGLFYPPTWLLFAANMGRERLLFWTLEVFMILHVWLGFLLCYAWLRWRGLAKLAAAFGGGVFAFSGYMLLQLQHFGLACGYAWMPLGLWGIDQAAAAAHWRPLWKLVAASALCFLAGYPPAWFVFAVAACAYALGCARPSRMGAWTGAALALSLAAAMVQLLPALEASSMKFHEARYGSGIRDPEFYISYFVPNYFDFALDSVHVRLGEYLYLGAPAIAGLAFWAWRRLFRESLPALAMLAAVGVALTNPFSLVWEIVRRSTLLSEICRDWYFLAGVTLAAAPVAATGLDAFLARGGRAFPRWVMPATIGAMAVWCVRLIAVWWRGGPEFASGWRAAIEPAVFLALFTAGLLALRAETGRRRSCLALALLLAAGVDYKAFGTSKRFNASIGKYDRDVFGMPFRGLDETVYNEIRSHPDFRVALDTTAPFPTMMRQYGLRTPQGFDPMLPAQYSEKLKEFQRPSDSRMFDLDPGREALLRSLGVRYFLTGKKGAASGALASNPHYRLLEPSVEDDWFHHAYELRDPQPSYRWEPAGASAGVPAERIAWSSAVREFVVRSEHGGRFVLAEQFYPGWRATVDGAPVEIVRHDGVFQAIAAPAGERRIRFEYRSPGLVPGSLVSAAAVAAVWLLARRRKSRVL
ncbi:MAG: hypothetical protein KIT09_02750 [Bryobacteraceae bacterium]|nr:hypothetical protein [Bryobacteraceae bacterium]